MPRPAKKKRGGQPDYVLNRDGRPIVGLSYDKTLNQYYSTHQRPKKYFGSDLDQAIVRFHVWQAERRGRKLVPMRCAPPGPATVRLAAPPEVVLPDGPIGPADVETLARTQMYVYVDPDALYEWARAEISTDSARFAERVGIPQIAWLDELEPPGPPLTLQQIGDLYFGKRKQISDHWRRKQANFWAEFRKHARKRTLEDVKRADIARYHDAVWDQYEKHGRSPTYVSHRIQAVRTILRNALKTGRDQRQIRRVLDLCEIFETPDKNGTNPRPISREDFHKLLEVSSPKWRAILTLALNCAFYPSEVAAVERSHIDWEAGTLVMERGKTGVPRAAVLWDRSIEAIREYQNAEPHESPYLFVSRSGLPYDANHIGRNFRRRRAKAGLDDSVTFDMIRDGSYSAAYDGGASMDQARMLAGHRVSGMSDHYVKRNPKMVADACTAIERAYFGDR